MFYSNMEKARQSYVSSLQQCVSSYPGAVLVVDGSLFRLMGELGLRIHKP